MATYLWHNIPSDMMDQMVIQTIRMLVDANAIPTLPPMSHAAEDLSVAVYCDDAQQSAVLFCCSRGLAVDFAATMLELDPSSLAETDLVDAIGEFANVIAGGLRGLMENPGYMSTPFVVTSKEMDLLDLSNEHSYLVKDNIFSVFRF